MGRRKVGSLLQHEVVWVAVNGHMVNGNCCCCYEIYTIISNFFSMSFLHALFIGQTVKF